MSFRQVVFFLLFLLSARGVCAGQVDINSADAGVLAEALIGVGATRAQAIVNYRAQHGPFRSVDELAAVHGIGADTVDRNRARIKAIAEVP